MHIRLLGKEDQHKKHIQFHFFSYLFPLLILLIFLTEWPLGSTLLRLPVVAHHCKARPPCSVWPFMFLPLFSDLSEWDVAYASMRILGCGFCSCFVFQNLQTPVQHPVVLWEFVFIYEGCGVGK